MSLIKKLDNNLSVFILFLLVSLFILKGVVFNSGIILGGDWSQPYTNLQIIKQLKIFSNTWGSANWGVRNLGLNGVLLSSLFYSLSLFNLNGAIISKLLLVFLFTLSSYSIYSLLRYLNCSRISSFVGGSIYITTPLFFDYAIMGWLYVILFMGLLPYAVKWFLKANLENKVLYSLITAIIYAVSLLQSQALIWFAIIFFILGFYLIKNKQTLFIYIKNLLTVFLTTFLLSFFWIGGLLIVKDSSIIGSDIVNSAPSIGTSAHFYPLNIVRLFGSLYNFQYEFIINNNKIAFLSFIIPLFAFLALLVSRTNKKVTLTFLIMGLFPMLMYVISLYRYLLVYIPYSNVFRDFARFTVFSTFSFSVLATLFLDYLYNKRKILFFIFVAAWAISVFPWWSGYISKWQINAGPNQRLRLKNIDKEYNDLDYFLAYKKLDRRAIFLPINGTVSFEDDDKFKGSYQEAQDIFAAYSPLGGQIVINDRNLGYGNLLNKNIIKNILGVDFKKIFLLSMLNQDYFILRKNMIFPDKSYVSKSLSDNEKLIKILDNNKIAVYKKIENFLPHLYTPKILITTNQNLETLPEIVSEKDYDTRSAIYFKVKKYNPGAKSVFYPTELKKETVKNTPILEYKKINPTKYRIVVHGAKGEFPLVFSESYHDKWNMYLTEIASSADVKRLPRNDMLKKYRILDGNEGDQASREELKGFIDKDWVSTLGDGKDKEIKHMKWEDNREKLDYVEKYNIDFVSKNFQDTIQNDNLSEGNIFETWFIKPIEDNQNHSLVNGFANSWTINTDKLCHPVYPSKTEGRRGELAEGSDKTKCVKNPDGSYDFEVIVEFWPQRLFYIGLAVSGTTLLGCLSYLALAWVRERKGKKEDGEIIIRKLRVK